MFLKLKPQKSIDFLIFSIRKAEKSTYKGILLIVKMKKSIDFLSFSIRKVKNQSTKAVLQSAK